MARYCVGPTMAVDWGEDDVPVTVTRGLLGRVFGYFTPWWRQGVVVAVCIAAESVLGLAPAVVFPVELVVVPAPPRIYADVAAACAGVAARMLPATRNPLRAAVRVSPKRIMTALSWRSTADRRSLLDARLISTVSATPRPARPKSPQIPLVIIRDRCVLRRA